MKVHHTQAHGEPLFPLSKDELEELYYGKRWSQYKIAETIGVSRNAVRSAMNSYDIEARERGDAFRIRFSRVGVHYYVTKEGYVQLKTTVDGEKRRAFVHQLIAIAEGEDPFKVFGQNGWVCHHENGVRWDNRGENITLMRRSEHSKEHHKRGDIPNLP